MSGSMRRIFGGRIRALRRERGLTQEELAQKSGLSVEAVGRIERGAFAPTLETIHKLSGGLGVPFHDLFHAPSSPEEPSPPMLGQLCQYVSGLDPPRRRAVWEVLLSLFGSERRAPDV